MSYYFSSLVAFNLGMHKHFRFRITKVKLFSAPFTSWDCVTLARHLMFNGNQEGTKKVFSHFFYVPLTFHRKMIHGYLPMMLTLFISPSKSLSWTFSFVFFLSFCLMSTWLSKLLIYPSCHAWRIRSTRVFTQYYMTTIEQGYLL